MNSRLEKSIQQLKESLEESIEQLLPRSDERPDRLHSSMRYSLCDGGKRVRGILLLLCSKIFKASADPLPASVAIECIHAYSLIHDDLPAIDNSDTRRNKPSNHIAFNEATAILAGDGLLTEAFKILSEHYKQTPELGMQLIQELATASSSLGMIGGQMEDIDNEGQAVDASTLEFIHKNKTAKLIEAAIHMGFSFSEESKHLSHEIRMLGYHLGMSFQYIDDLLDVQSDEQTLGKPTGADLNSDKLTSVKVFGIEGTQKKITEHNAQVEAILKQIDGDTATLLNYIQFLQNRLN
jgi:geranylgeranyl pyrophosphate synthase